MTTKNKSIDLKTEEGAKMKFQVIFKTSRSIAIELLEQGIYYTEKEFSIFLNGVCVKTSNKVVNSIYHLLPDTQYELYVQNEEEKSEVLKFTTEYEFVTLNVKKFGAKGDGIQDDTIFLQTAINSCPKDGRVLIPEGIYKISSLFLKSDLYIEIEKNAVLSAYTERSKFPVLPGLIESYDETEEYNLGTWEGNPLDMFSSIITGINVSNVIISGEGILDGNASYENWWKGEGREKIGAFRPRMIFLNHCENITVHGLKVQNSPSWNLHPYFSNHTKWIDMTVLNPKISPNTDGMDPESVDGLLVVGVHFSLGDDCIAVKSGKYYMGHKYKVPSQNIEIRQCYMQNGHGSVTLGSEMAAGVKHLIVRDCLFEDTDRGLRVKTRRGRGKDAVIDDILFENIKMNGVLTPFVINSYYWCCDPDGHTEYVRSKKALPVDERTPEIKQLTFKNIEARNCHVAGTFIYGLPEKKIEEITFADIVIDYAEHPIPEYPAMMADVEACTNMGIYIKNVKKLIMNNVSITGYKDKDLEIYNVDQFIKDGVEQ